MTDQQPLQFAYPAVLWLGVFCGVVAASLFVLANRRRERDLACLAHARLLPRLTQSVSRWRRRVRQAIWVLALLLLFVALARPQYGFEYREVKRRGIDLVFAVDTSRSMLADDVAPNRLERAQMAITDFVDRLQGDRIGLIPFAGNAFSLCPLTLDYGAFRQSLEALDINIIPHMGTDLASAVKEANRLFDEEGNNHRILILITDGEDLQGEVDQAIAEAKKKEMTIHTVGIGDPNGALIPLKRPDGSEDFVRDSSGQPVRTALDEVTLREIADATSGIYASLGPGGQGLDRIYREKLRLVPKSEMEQRLDRVPLERFEWPLAAAILLLVVEFLVGERRRLPLNRRNSLTAFILLLRARRAVGPGAALGLLLVAGAAEGTMGDESGALPLSDDPRKIYNLGTEAYRTGDFKRADEMLFQSLGETTDLSLQQRAYYNLGNARFRLGQQSLEQNPGETMKRWKESLKAYEDAIELDPGDEDAVFNRDLVKRKLEELEEQQESQDEQQESQDEQQDEQQDGQEESQDGQQENQGGQQENQGEQEENQGEQEENRDGQPQESEEDQPSRTDENERSSGQFSEERRAPGEMSEEEAAQLLEALEKDEESVIPLPDMNQYRRAVPNNTTRGKTW